jgi:hypothetical protein
MARHRLISTVRPTDVVSVFQDDDAGLLRYRAMHPAGYVVSVGEWLHIYRLQDDRWLKLPFPHYTHSKTNHKLCVVWDDDVPTLVEFTLTNLATPRSLDQVHWGASGVTAGALLTAALAAMDFHLSEDGYMVRSVPAREWLRRNIG